jgi:hypothetical protein
VISSIATKENFLLKQHQIYRFLLFPIASSGLFPSLDTINTKQEIRRDKRAPIKDGKPALLI